MWVQGQFCPNLQATQKSSSFSTFLSGAETGFPSLIEDERDAQKGLSQEITRYARTAQAELRM